MNTNNQNQAINAKENVLAGIVGAFLFALAGGVLWFLLDRIGFIAGISGIVGVIAANRGYTFFAKGSSKKGIIISTIVALLVLVLAWYLCFSLDLLDVTKVWYEEGDIDYLPSYFECVGSAYLYLAEPDVAYSYVMNLIIGLALAIVASVPTFKQLMNAEKMAKEAPVATEFTEAENTDTQTETAAEEQATEDVKADSEENN
jgi:hypothetical protein